MKKLVFSFCNLAIIGLFLSGALTFAQAQSAPPGKVTKVNQNTHTFTVQWLHESTHHHFTAGRENYSTERTFRTTEKTTYQVGSANGSWSDLQVGVRVNVKSHKEGADRVADNVQIIKSS